MNEEQESLIPYGPWPFDREDENARTEYIMREIARRLDEGQEDIAADLIYTYSAFNNPGKWRCANVLYVFYDRFKDPAILYRCIIDTYTNDGYNFPRSVMIRAKKISPSIPEAERFEDLPEGDVFTVYRAASSPINKVRNDLSWTINKDVAIWFANRQGYMFDGALKDTYTPLSVYTGTIERDKIIAYTNGRNEYEVIQHGSVKNIVELHPTTEEIEHAMEWKASLAAAEDNF